MFKRVFLAKACITGCVLSAFLLSGFVLSNLSYAREYECFTPGERRVINNAQKPYSSPRKSFSKPLPPEDVASFATPATPIATGNPSPATPTPAPSATPSPTNAPRGDWPDEGQRAIQRYPSPLTTPRPSVTPSPSPTPSEGIEIQGSLEFFSATIEALEMLKHTQSFQTIKEHISIIKENSFSGMAADAERPTFLVGERTWQSSTVWYASAIAHDAYHSKLYHEGQEWVGVEAEKKSLVFQLAVLRELNAREYMVKYVEDLIDDPYYINIPRDW